MSHSHLGMVLELPTRISSSVPLVWTISQTLSANVLTNGDFSAWTTDNPDGWSISGESGSDPMVTQTASDGSAGTGAARFYSSASSFDPKAGQSGVLTVGTLYDTVATVTQRTSGSVFVGTPVGVNIFGTLNAVATRRALARADSTNFLLTAGNAPTSLVLDTVAVYPITLNTQQVAPSADMRLDMRYTLPASPAAGSQIWLLPRISDFSAGNYWSCVLDYTGSQWNITLYTVATHSRTSRIAATNIGATNGVRVNMNADSISLYTSADDFGSVTQRGTTITNTTYQTATGVNAIHTSDFTAPITITYEPSSPPQSESIVGPVTITPTLGAELLTNGDFSAWSSDNPTGWTITGESGSDPEVTERDPNQTHADTKTTGGAANLYATASVADPRLRQNVITTGTWYQLRYDITARNSGQIRYTLGGTAIDGAASVGNHVAAGRAAGIAFQLFTWVTAHDLTVDNVSVKPITLASAFDVIADTFVPRVIKAKVTRTASTQAGVAHYADDNNFVVAYLDGHNNVILLKRVGGTYTQIATASITYSAGAELELRYDPDAKTYSVYYNDSVTPKINAASVTDAVFVTATGSRLFSTYDDNSFSDIFVSEV